MPTKDLSLQQRRAKDRRYKDNKAWRQENERRLTDEVIDKLLDMDHPKLKGDEHSMYSYVLWLNSNGHTFKAKEIIDAISTRD